MNSKPGVVHYLCGYFSGALIQNNRITGIYNQEGSERLAFCPMPIQRENIKAQRGKGFAKGHSQLVAEPGTESRLQMSCKGCPTILNNTCFSLKKKCCSSLEHKNSHPRCPSQFSPMSQVFFYLPPKGNKFMLNNLLFIITMIPYKEALHAHC